MYPYYFHNHHDMLTGYSTTPNDGSGFEDLLATIAAEHFPLNDGKPIDEECSPISALSPISTCSGESSSATSSHDRGLESDWDPDSDVEELVLQDPTESSNSQALRVPSAYVGA